MKQKSLIACGVTVGSVILVLALFFTGLLESPELKILDLRFRYLAEQSEADTNIVLAAIDESSLQQFKEQGIVWKWPRDIYGELVNYLYRGGAKAVVFDITFTEPDIDRANSDAEATDGAFADAMRASKNVILATGLMNDERLAAMSQRIDTIPPYMRYTEEKSLQLPKYVTALPPIPLFQTTAASIGTVNYYEDPHDGMCRKLPLISKAGNDIYPHTGLAAYLVSTKTRDVIATSQGTLRIGSLEVPVDREGHFLLWWYGKGGPEGSFKYYSIASLIVSSLREQTGQPPIIPASAFKNKTVIVGSNAMTLADFRNTPFATSETPFPGMEIYATMLSNFRQQHFLTRLNPITPLIITLFFAAAVTFLFLYGKKVIYVIGAFILLAALWLEASVIAFTDMRIWIDVVPPIVGLTSAFLISAVVSYQMEGRARRKLRSTFSRYVSPVVIREVLDKTDEVKLGGKEITGTVYFSDLKDFTNMSETMTPTDLVSLLNDYFTIVTREILKAGGLVDKYIGDAVMSLYGAPLERPDHAVLACNAALAVQKSVPFHWSKLKHKWPSLHTRIGINSGPMVVGNIGSDLRLDYTAIGDTVNLASRLEGVNKMYGTDVIISENTHKFLAGQFVLRELDYLAVKGKEKPTAIFELIGKDGEVSSEIIRRNKLFQDGLNWYRERNFERAKEAFDELLYQWNNDGPATVFSQRCELFMTQAPPPDWDGVFRLKTK